MENNTSAALEFSANILIFLGVVTYIIYSFLDLPKAFDDLKGPETVYIQEQEIPKADLWSGEQVIGLIYRIGDDEVPITVDGIKFESDSDLKENQSKVDLQKKYIEEIKYDNEGIISEIVFKAAS